MKQHYDGKINLRLISFLVLILVVIAGVSIYFIQHRRQQSKQIDLHGVLFANPRSVGHFNLIDNQGSPFTEKSLVGHWTFMFFGFTNCGYVCPKTMAELQQAYQILQNQKNTLPKVVMISVDPKRDTVAAINQYVTSFNRAFIGATGKKEEIDRLTKAMSILYMQVAKNSPSGQRVEYDIDHSGSIMIVDPNGHLRGLFSSGSSGQEIAHDYQTIMRVTKFK